MDHGAARDIDPADRFTLDGVEFVPSWDRPSEPGSLTLLKSTQMVEQYRDLIARHPRPRMVELGISQGGSVGWLALAARPVKLVAVELSDEPIAPLVDMLREKGLDATVRPYFGVDQADRARLREIVEAEMEGEPLDLVVDDASHLYAPTVASFEVLFPLLRPGGTYVIEDWTWLDQFAIGLRAVVDDDSHPLHAAMQDRIAQIAAGTVRRDVPVSRIALELVLAQAQSGGIVDGVSVDDTWIVVRRGHAPLAADGFTLSSLYGDDHGLLTPVGR